MSGGHFDYKQYIIDHIADEVEQLILNNGSDEKDEHGTLKYEHLSDEVIHHFKDAYVRLRLAAIYAQRIDWLVSGDDSEESFKHRLQQEIDDLFKSGKYKKVMGESE